MNKNIFVIPIDMNNRTVEDIAKDTAVKIIDITDKLIEKQKCPRRLRSEKISEYTKNMEN